MIYTEAMIPWLNPTSFEFPQVETALDDPNGLLAAGGDLSIDRLLAAYKLGIFPWYCFEYLPFKRLPFL